jgi:hypothetical protein
VTDVYRTRAGVRAYSVDPGEEARLLTIRDTPGARVRMIAQARIKDPALPLHPIELHWLRQPLRPSAPLPWLLNVEWDALARTLLGAIREVHVVDARREWERAAGMRALPELQAMAAAAGTAAPGPETMAIEIVEDEEG